MESLSTFSSIFTEPMAILELCALVFTIVYVGKLALQDLLTPEGHDQSLNAGPGLKRASTSPKTKASQVEMSIFSTPKVNCADNYRESYKESKRITLSKKALPKKPSQTRKTLSQRKLELWGKLGSMIEVGSLISLPKRSLGNQSELLSS